jgi:hypothetical protein
MLTLFHSLPRNLEAGGREWIQLMSTLRLCKWIHLLTFFGLFQGIHSICFFRFWNKVLGLEELELTTLLVLSTIWMTGAGHRQWLRDAEDRAKISENIYVVH